MIYNYKKIKNNFKTIKKYTKYWHLGLGMIKVVIGLISNSFFVILNALYNLGIFFVKKLNYDINKKGENTYRSYFFIALILIVSSIIYIIYSARMFITDESSNYNMIVAIVIAVVSFTEITFALIGVFSAHKTNNINTLFEKLINLSTAFISMVLTQTAILSFSYDGNATRFNGFGGLFFGLLNTIIGIYMLIYANKQKKYMISKVI